MECYRERGAIAAGRSPRSASVFRIPGIGTFSPCIFGMHLSDVFLRKSFLDSGLKIAYFLKFFPVFLLRQTTFKKRNGANDQKDLQAHLSVVPELCSKSRKSFEEISDPESPEDFFKPGKKDILVFQDKI
jgi:hypothetical protein